MPKILVIDDEENIRTSLKSAFDKRGHTTVTAEGAARGREFASAGFDLILLDVLLPDGNGIDLLKQFLKDEPNRPVVMISGHADIETAVKAIRLGAYDFIEKPLSLDHILVTIDNATRTGQLVLQNQRLREIVYGELVGESPQIRQLRDEIIRAAPKTDRFLVLGENGTGKELVAHLIHSHSRNADGPFVPVNCAALPRELVESELFGHKAGAFTGATRNRKGRFQEADGGTLFLDEISEMPLDAQAKILRVLEDHKVTAVGSDSEQQVDIVVIAASNRNLDEESKNGKFRQDLYYRLNVVSFTIPPLRERMDDLKPLAGHFLSRFARETGTPAKQLSDDALALLRTQEFRGNVRELRNLLERIHIYTEHDTVSAGDIQSVLPLKVSGEPSTLKDAVSDFERDYIRSALSRSSGNVAETARRLGLERSHLYKKMKKLGLD